jgi:hypothetical protein
MLIGITLLERQCLGIEDGRPIGQNAMHRSASAGGYFTAGVRLDWHTGHLDILISACI